MTLEARPSRSPIPDVGVGDAGAVDEAGLGALTVLLAIAKVSVSTTSEGKGMTYECNTQDEKSPAEPDRMLWNKSARMLAASMSAL